MTSEYLSAPNAARTLWRVRLGPVPAGIRMQPEVQRGHGDPLVLRPRR